MKKNSILFCLIFVTIHSVSQNEVIHLWNTIPNSKKTSEIEVIKKENINRVYKVKNPTLEIFTPTKQNRTGKAIIICHGGGYGYLAYDWEGTDIAKWLNSKGITAFVLKYRLPNSKSIITSYNAPIQDAQRAIRYVRFNAEKFDININKIGVIGFSAGGHLAATLGT
ncbi:alpha/beta hydrolase [uncultured Polaribacter sp.]|uniref:alpha/beta hydrolase n=1 Tax=uncultured Polaribacter sp. TaxID=174711 RepID=UPI00260A8FDB|nr:alpha/beta hydrolase [uncultured Polaribacter sp.]